MLGLFTYLPPDTIFCSIPSNILVYFGNRIYAPEETLIGWRDRVMQIIILRLS